MGPIVLNECDQLQLAIALNSQDNLLLRLKAIEYVKKLSVHLTPNTSTKCLIHLVHTFGITPPGLHLILILSIEMRRERKEQFYFSEFMMHLVVKEMPVSQERRAQFRVPQAFEREAMAYDQVLPLLGTPALAMFPRCLNSQPIVVLEDLRANGFSMSDRHRGLDLDHCRVAIKVWPTFSPLKLYSEWVTDHMVKSNFHVLVHYHLSPD